MGVFAYNYSASKPLRLLTGPNSMLFSDGHRLFVKGVRSWAAELAVRSA